MAVRERGSWAGVEEDVQAKDVFQTEELEEDMQMANRYIERCSTSLIIREMQSKTTMRYLLTPVRIAIINKSKNMVRMWRKGNPHTLLVVSQIGAATVEKFGGSSKN